MTAKLGGDGKVLLVMAGQQLYGGAWQAPLASALGLSSERRIRGWLSGKPIPAGIWRDVRELLARRQEGIAGTIGLIDTGSVTFDLLHDENGFIDKGVLP